MKNMKTIGRIIFLPALIFFFSVSVFAGERIVDNAGILSPEEKADLLKMADSIASANNFDLVIVTEKDTGNKTPMEYADDFFDYNGYGAGEDRDGCLLLNIPESRDYWFSTSGRGEKILDRNSYAFDKLEADVIKFLKAGKYYEAYRVFILDMETFLALEAKGRSYNFFQRWNLVVTGVAWFLALAIGFIIVSVWKKGMNTALQQTQAAAYVVPGSLAFREKNDRFLYSTVTKTKKQSQSSSGGGTHRSSSGRSHGGRGGRY